MIFLIKYLILFFSTLSLLQIHCFGQQNSESTLILVTSFGSWKSPTPNASTRIMSLLKKQLQFPSPYLLDSDSDNQFSRKASDLCLAKFLDFANIKSIKNDFISELLISTDLSLDAYLDKMCPTIIENFKFKYKTPQFDFFHIVLPTDEKLSAKFTMQFYEKMVSNECTHYKKCAIISMGEVSSGQFISIEDAYEKILDKDSYEEYMTLKEFYSISQSEEDAILFAKAMADIAAEMGPRNIKIATGVSLLSDPSIKDLIIANDKFPNTFSTCGQQAFCVNETCSSYPKNPIPFLFFHISNYIIDNENIFGLNPGDKLLQVFNALASKPIDENCSAAENAKQKVAEGINSGY